VTPTRTILMIGASRGLGFYAAQHILRAYPDVHLVVTSRDSEAGSLARRLEHSAGGGRVSELRADLANLDSIRDLAENISALAVEGAIPPLYVVLANAGAQLMSTTRTTDDGHEMTFGVNVLANAVLIDELAPRLAIPGRIVITTSDTHFGGFRHNMGMVPAPVWRSPDDLAMAGTGPKADRPRAGGIAYATSKLAVIYYVHALASRLPEGIDVYSYNPGLVPGTGLARDRNFASRAAWRAVMPMMTVTPWAASPKRAGTLLAQAAAGPRPGDSGSYLDRGREARSSDESYDPARENELWHVLRRLGGLSPRRVD
jgi:NAD(P)-dependent dehydrogenase (short-subunit alcohol dehydrogenase family)